MNPLSEFPKEGEYSSTINLSDTINSLIDNEPESDAEENERCILGGDIESDDKNCEINIEDDAKDSSYQFLKPESKPIRTSGPRALRRRPGNGRCHCKQ